jgi:3D (Asp-Asp-Asp) domain-containing protein
VAIAIFWLASLALFAATRVAATDAKSRNLTAPATVAHRVAASLAPTQGDNPPGHRAPLALLRPAVKHSPPPAIIPGNSSTLTRYEHAKSASRPSFAKAAYVSPKPPAARRPAHTMQVWVTGYDLAGTTATGTQTGPGVCAVDPYVIPLGTHLTIAGVGQCTALDTGPDIAGARVDVWVPDYQTAANLTGWYTATW